MFSKKSVSAALALTLSLTIAGCGGGSKAVLSKTTNNFVANGKSLNGQIVAKTASITPAKATAAALVAQPGTAGVTELGDENGIAAYAVHITAASGKKYDVKVDANTGTVFSIEADDASAETNGDSGSVNENK